jgi:type I restriction enzyme S subunit
VAEPRFSSVDKLTHSSETPVRLCNYIDVYNHEYITEDLEFMRASAIQPEIDRFGLKVGDVIITKDSETPDDIGVPAVVDYAAPDLVCGYHLALIRPDQEQVDPTFLAKQLKHFRLARYFGQQSNGLTRYGLPIGSVNKAPLWLPELLDEQKAIGKVLRLVDEAIAKTEAVIAKLRQVRAGLLHDLFTRGLDHNGQLRDPIAHPEQFQESPLGCIPKHWSPIRIKDEADILHGYAFDGRHFTDKPLGPRLLVPGNFHRDGGLYFTDDNTKYFTSSYPPETLLNNGDMLIVMTDLSPMTLILGSTVLLNEPFPVLHNQRIGKFRLKRPDDWSRAFFVTMMNDDRLRRKVIREATGTTVRHTSPDRIRSGFAFRPRPEEQKEIVRRLEEMDYSIVAAVSEATKLRCVKSGLMTDLLTGRVRVPETIGITP